MMSSRWARRVGIVTVVCAVAVLLVWPLPLHLFSHLTGDPAGDLGVYVWNIWVFHHELMEHGRLPFSTDHVFAFTQGADFALHNYTPLAGLLGLPLLRAVGVVGTFNLLLMAASAASGLAVVLLARRLGIGPVAAVAAGVIFIAAPTHTARQVAHASLVATAGLPLFLWQLLRVLERERHRDAVTLGALTALASYSDAYLGIYCALAGAVVLAPQFACLERRPAVRAATDGRRLALRLLNGVLAVATLIVALRLAGYSGLELGPLRIRIEPIYTPVLILTVGGLLRALSRRPVRLVPVTGAAERLRRLLPLAATAVGTCVLLMAPPLLGVARRMLLSRMPTTDVFWRSSPRGVDLLGYLVPNPLNPWFGQLTAGWFMPSYPDAFPEFVASFSIVAIIAIAIATARRQLPALWLGFTAIFAALSLGPFVHVASVNTFVPGPWALLRYVPIVDLARAPSRFSIVASLGFALLFGWMLDGWLRSASARSRTAAAVVVLLCALELTPAPRRLFRADVPEVYRLLATGDESGAIMELPTGIRDGTSSLGDFQASTQFYQTHHGRPLVGGYLSRVSTWRREETMRNPVLRVLVELSAPSGAVQPERLLRRARRRRDDFLARTCVGFVVIDSARASRALRDAATDILRLVPVHSDGRYELFQPDDPPPCRASASAGLSARWAARRGPGPQRP